jgi:HPt (histidine-containing phosphotransfer) domain-containing protein
MQVGGDERDDVFLMELLVCFYSEGIPRLKKLIEACLIYRKGGTWVKGDGVADRTIEATIKEEAHAIKGSAANIRLWRLAKVSIPLNAAIKST